MRTKKPIDRPYDGDVAERRTVTGWVCKTCNRFWGDDEHMARYCCCTSRSCGTEGCAGRCEKHYTKCETCRELSGLERYLAREVVPWDGKCMIALDSNDRYFSDAEEFLDYVVGCRDPGDFTDEEAERPPTAEEIEAVRPMETAMMRPRHFSVSEFCEEMTTEDGEQHFRGNPAEIDEIVNKWLAENGPQLWEATRRRLDPKSLIGE